MNIKTSSLIIRNWCLADIEPYFDLVSSSEAMRFIGEGVPLSKDAARDFVNKSISDDQNSLIHNRKAVALMESNELIGCCGLKQCNWGLDFGWRYRQKFWGNGYATEAASALLAYFSAAGIRDFVCVVNPLNLASKSVIEKIGLDLAGNISINGLEALKYMPSYNDKENAEKGR